MKAYFSNIAIAAIAGHLPEQIIGMEHFRKWFGQEEAKRIAASTGVSEVRYASTDECSSDLCFNAAEKLLKNSGIGKDEIDALIFVTQTPDYRIPGNSFLLHKRLGLRPDCLPLDIPTGCSGYIYGLFQAAMLINQDAAKRVLLLAGETNSKMIADEDRSLRMVFGDAGTATLIEKGKGNMLFEIMADGGGYEALCIPEGAYRQSEMANNTGDKLFMDGMEVMNFALREVPPMMDRMLEINQWDRKDVFFGLHQANAFMLNYLRKKMGIPAENVPIKMEKTGNTGPASIPLLLSSLSSNDASFQYLDKSILCGFGVGLSWAACSADLSKTQFIAA